VTPGEVATATRAVVPAPAPGGAGAGGTDPVAAAVAYLVRSTASRPQTEAELRARLSARDVPDDVADAALGRGKAAGIVDDAAFARAWVADRGGQRGFGAARLRQELRRRLVPEPLADEALRALEDRDDLAVATELAAQRARRLPASLEPEAVARRLVAFLVRRGHPPGLAQRIAVQVSGLGREWD